MLELQVSKKNDDFSIVNDKKYTVSRIVSALLHFGIYSVN